MNAELCCEKNHKPKKDGGYSRRIISKLISNRQNYTHNYCTVIKKNNTL